MTAPHLQLFTDVMSGSGTAVAVMGSPSRTSISFAAWVIALVAILVMIVAMLWWGVVIHRDGGGGRSEMRSTLVYVGALSVGILAAIVGAVA